MSVKEMLEMMSDDVEFEIECNNRIIFADVKGNTREVKGFVLKNILDREIRSCRVRFNKLVIYV